MKKKKIVLFVFLIVGVLSLILTYKLKQNNLSKNKPIKEEKLSIMIKEDGATDYTKSSSKDIPKGDYVLNEEKTHCENNGQITSYDSTTGTVSFAFIGSDKCYLYFDYKEDTSLYGIVKKRYNNSDTYVKLYNGTDYGDTTNYANNIYYFTGNVENNNVLFANYCWKIVRTTDTGGVKIVYNGVQKDGSCNNTGENSQIGTSAFNSNYNSPAYVGYMYNENKVYTYSSKAIINNTYFSGTYAYADAVTYDSSTNTYTLTNATTLDITRSNISSLVGKYTCNSSSTTGTCSRLWYIVGYSGSDIYYYLLSNGDIDGTDNGSDYVFGSSFTYANGTYTLAGTTTINTDTWSTNYANVNTHHYTCLTNGNSCTSVYYIYYDYNGTLYYITLTGGKSVEDALNEMLYADDVNTKDSTIKAYIDSWYEKNIKDKYDDKLEDTVFCNDRSISSLNGWNPNGGSTSGSLYFKNNDENNKSLECANETDRFSVSNTKAQLKYPIGLLTVPELSLAGYGSSHYFNNGLLVWIGSPIIIDNYYARVKVVYSGGWGSSVVSAAMGMGIRPSISLKTGTEISSGDGSYTNPFVINDPINLTVSNSN